MSDLDPRLGAFFAAHEPSLRDPLFVNETLLRLGQRRPWRVPLAWMGVGAAASAGLMALGPLAGPALGLIGPLAAPAALIWSAFMIARGLGWARV